MATAVVIPTFNRRATILSALHNLFDVLPAEHHVIVVDSGSSDSTADAVKSQFPRAVLLPGAPDMWWAAATNLGLRKAKELGCEQVIAYNDDNVATRDLFTNLHRSARVAPTSVISAVCCYLDRPSTVFFAGRMRAQGSDRFYHLNHDAPLSTLSKGLRRVDLLHGMCTLFPMAVFDTVGLFDEVAFPHIFADDDLLLRASQAGFPLQVALDAIVLNDRSQTGINPYDRRLGPVGVFRLFTSRKSSFQLTGRTRFLWRHRRSTLLFCKTWLSDYLRLFTVVLARWILPPRGFHWLGRKWGQRLEQR